MKILTSVLIGLLVADDVCRAAIDTKKETPPSKSNNQLNGNPARETIALAILQNALKGIVFDAKNPRRFPALWGTEKISFVSRVTKQFPGEKEFKGQNFRRLTFSVSEKGGKNSLILEQSHVGVKEPVLRSVIAKGVDVFFVFYWSPIIGDWINTWNRPVTPLRLKINIALMQPDGAPALERDLISREIYINKNAVPNWSVTEQAIEQSIRKVLGKPNGVLTKKDCEEIKTLGLFWPPNIPKTNFPDVPDSRTITDISLIARLTKLEELYCLNGAQIDESELIRLKEKLPKCAVIVHSPATYSTRRGSKRDETPNPDAIFNHWSKLVPKRVRDGIDADKDGKFSDSEKKSFLKELNKRAQGTRHYED